MLRILSLIFIVLIFLSCANTTKEKETTDNIPAVADAAIKPKKISDIEPGIWKANNLQVLFYDDPDGDSLRYSRFFTYTEISDSGKVNLLLRELDQHFVTREKKRDCRSEGKLFLMNKEDILKTLYFSTRGDSCSYMYLIKDGAFKYFSLTENAKNFLKESKKLAKKPG